MKQLLFIALLLCCIGSAYAQRNVELSVHLSESPTLSFYLQNDGTDTLFTTDTVTFIVPDYGATFYVGYYIPPGDTMQFNYPEIPVKGHYCIEVSALGHSDTDCVDIVTSIEEIRRSKQPVRVYNMQGILQHGYLVPGVYIINRRKVIIR